MRRLVILAVVAAGIGLAVALALVGPVRPVAPEATLAVAEALGGADTAGYLRAVAPRQLSFPADHGPHPGYRNEWWYLTGNVRTADGRPFGYQVTFFRTALAPSTPMRASAWATRDVYMAHFAITDVVGGRFLPHHRLARGAAGLAGARAVPLRVWTEDWMLQAEAQAGLPARLRAAAGQVALDLHIEPGKPMVLQGDQGLSRKGPEPGNASYYYSFTRLPTRGTLRIGPDRFEVRGASWMDREWSTSALGDKVGWDWFALQLADGRDVMYYQLRRADGSTDRFSAGVLVAADGHARALRADDVRLEVLDTWASPRGGTRYPARWRLSVPSADLHLEVRPALADQELPGPVRYWEGAVRIRPVAPGGGPAGAGYVELVGYAATARDAPPPAGRAR